MTLYMDTSALIKLYFDESGSADVRERVQQFSMVATSRIAYIETLCAVARKVREDALSKRDRLNVLKAFGRDWDSFFVIEAAESVCLISAELVERHPLRALDAIHLASALLLRSKIEKEVEFYGFDERLNRAAAAEGF